jgi:acetylornithine deacetylase/succinyl-diaminopimelate desuccinylase-like protein
VAHTREQESAWCPAAQEEVGVPRLNITAREGLTGRQRDYLAAARAQLTMAEVEELLTSMVATPSPTGEEGALALRLVDRMDAAGIRAAYQEIGPGRGNAVGRIPGAGNGASLLLYGHLDVHLTGRPDEDGPAAHGGLSRMSAPGPYTEGDLLFGLGAGNPKGYAACMLAAAIAIAKARVPLAGDLIAGLAAGGMPANAPAGAAHRNIGHGAGCAHMLQQGVRPDFAVIGKPGHAVAWEEVGLCCFRIRVKGELGYAGARHTLEYRNPVIGAASLALEIERWLESYTKRNTTAHVAPQGVVGAVQAGWPHKPTFVPAWADLFLDVRVRPSCDPVVVQRELESALAEIMARHEGLDAELELTLAVPGSRTDPESWIIGSCIRAFEEAENRRHEPMTATSGASDANVLRMWGIPTARLGMATAWQGYRPTLELDLNSVHLPSMLRYIETLLYVVIDTCCRERAQVFRSA